MGPFISRVHPRTVGILIALISLTAMSVLPAVLAHGTAPPPPLSPVPAVSITSFTISPNPILVGDTTYLNMSISGGSGLYLYNYTQGTPSSCPQSGSVSSATSYSVACTPSVAGSYSIRAVVVDLGNFNSASASANLAVNSAPVGPTITSFSAFPPTITVGGSTYFNVSATGGTLPYIYVYTGLPAGCPSANTNSLACTPTAKGNYSVSVTVTDSSGLSTNGQTQLTVNPSLGPTISSFTATPAAFTLGGTTSLVVTATGGKAPYSFAYSGLPPGCTSSNQSTLSCTPTSTGPYNVTGTVTDMNARTASSKVTVTVNRLPTISAFSATPSSLTVGGQTILSTTVAGGTAPYIYAYSSLPPGCSSANVPSLTCTPTSPGSYTASVAVTDADGKAAGPSTTTISVNGKPVLTSFTAAPATFPLEGTTVLTASISGGTSPFHYSYTHLPPGCSTQDTSSLSCTPTQPRTFTVNVSATDSSGQAIVGSTSFTVTPVPTILSFSANPSPVSPHSTTILTVSATGGATPYSYLYAGLPVGCTSASVSTLSCTPVASGRYNVTVTVTDGKGNFNSSNTTLDVTSQSAASPTISSFGVSPSSVAIGGSVAFTVQVTGGTLPYSYTYLGLPPGCATGNAAQLTCSPTSPGNYSVKVTVTDAAGKGATSSPAALTVTGTPGVLVVGLTSNATYAWVNQAFTLTGTVSGGVGPFSYVLETNSTNSSAEQAYSTWSESERHGGNYSFTLWVTDGKGVVSGSHSVHVQILTPSSGNRNPSGQTQPPGWLIAVASTAIVLGVLLVLLLFLKRRRPSAPPETETPQTFLYGSEPTQTLDEGLLSPTLEAVPEEVHPSNPLEPGEMPQGTEPTGALPPVPQGACPQCNAPMDEEMVCYNCGVSWHADDGQPSTSMPSSPDTQPAQEVSSPTPPPPEHPEDPAPTLNLCPKCQRPVGPELICYSCGSGT